MLRSTGQYFLMGQSRSLAAAPFLDLKGPDKCTFVRVHVAQFGRTIKLRTIDTAAFKPNQGTQETNIKRQSRTAPEKKSIM
jgi:hypothetical protein